MARDPVLQWSSLAVEASAQTGVPASTILGLVSVESGGHEGLTSSAHAGGLTQFTPGTASDYGVDVSPGHARSQIFGAAHYLVDLGYAKDPELALAGYNAGPGNPAAAGDYPQKVLQAAKNYMGFDHGAKPPASSSSSSASSAPSTSSSSGPLVSSGQHSTLVQFGVAAALVLAAVVAIAAGVARATGVGQSIKLPGVSA